MRRHVPEAAGIVCAVVANQLSSKYRRYMDREDLVQTAYEWVLSHPRKTQEYLSDEDQKKGSAMLATAIRNHVKRAGEKAKASALGYQYRDLYFYTPGQIKSELLPAVFDKELWAYPPRNGTSNGQSDPSERGNWTAMLADVGEAFTKLPVRLKGVVELTYLDKLDQAEAGRVLEVDQSTVSKWLDEACKKMTDYLGGRRPAGCPDDCECTGHRKVRSNAASQAMTSEEY